MESTVLGGAAFEAQLTLGQLKSPNTMQSDRREMMVSSVQIRNMLSRGGVLGLQVKKVQAKKTTSKKGIQ